MHSLVAVVQAHGVPLGAVLMPLVTAPCPLLCVCVCVINCIVCTENVGVTSKRKCPNGTD